MADTLERLTAALADRYAIQRELGRGGMATVYLAEDTKLERRVAVKVLKPELAAVLGSERFLREVKITARLEHPHILGLYDSGEADGFLYYVMPYVAGESLRDRLDREKQLPIEEALEISREVADALSYAHSHDVIHRDIKPENILLESGHAVVADFGIARAITAAGGDRLTETGMAIGTPTYMSPEQAAGSTDLDGRSDLYSLGCVLYEMLAGQPPFTGPGVENVVRQHLTAEAPAVTNLRPAVPAEVSAALSRALAKTPADRFSPVAQFADALRPPVAWTESAPAGPKTGWWKTVLGAASVLLVAGGGWFAYRAVTGGEDAPAEAAFKPYVIVSAVEGSADAAMREAVASLFALSLEGSGAVRPLTDGQIRQALQAAGRPDTTHLDVDVAIELAVRGNFRPVIVPTVDQVGETYVLAARVLDADEDGTVMASARAEASGRDEVIDATDAVVRQVIESLGGSSEPMSNRDLAQIATPSFEALQLLRSSHVGGAMPYSEAVEPLHEALRLDPGFAMAWRRLAMAHRNAGYIDSARAALTEALRHEDRFTPQQRLEAEGALALINWDVAAVFRAWDRLRKEHGFLDDNLTYVLRFLGRWEDALAFENEIIAQRPYGPNRRDFDVRFETLLGLDRPDEALASLSAPRPDHYRWYHLVSAHWSALDSVAALIEADRTETPGARRYATALRASAFAASGRVRAAEEALDRSIVDAYEQGLPRAIRSYETSKLLLGMVSDRPLRTPRGETAGDTNAAAWTHRALQTALTGDTATAKGLLARVAALPAEDRVVLGAAPQVAEAAVATAGSRWDAVPPLIGTAAAWVWPARTYVLGLDYAGICRVLLADAHERLGHPDSAVVYLQLLATPAEMYKADEGEHAGLTYSFAHFRLGKLYAQLEQYDRAEEHYLTFLETFTEPDPEYEGMVTEARAALEGLARGR